MTKIHHRIVIMIVIIHLTFSVFSSQALRYLINERYQVHKDIKVYEKVKRKKRKVCSLSFSGKLAEHDRCILFGGIDCVLMLLSKWVRFSPCRRLEVRALLLDPLRITSNIVDRKHPLN